MGGTFQRFDNSRSITCAKSSRCVRFDFSEVFEVKEKSLTRILEVGLGFEKRFEIYIYLDYTLTSSVRKNMKNRIGLLRLIRQVINLPFAVFYFIYSLFHLIVLLLLPRKIFFSIYQNLELKEERKRIASLKDYLTAGERLLDVGAGSGRFGKKIQDDLNVIVQGVDVVDYAEASIPVHVYDGKKLPFPDKSFDVVLVAFVLHHITHQDVIFRELIRCARKKIFILEDTYDTPWQHLFIMWNDYHTNILQEHIKIGKGYSKSGVTDMPMPMTFRSVAQWKKFFSLFPLKVVDIAIRHSGYKPLSKVTFCLEVTDGEGKQN